MIFFWEFIFSQFEIYNPKKYFRDTLKLHESAYQFEIKLLLSWIILKKFTITVKFNVEPLI